MRRFWSRQQRQEVGCVSPTRQQRMLRALSSNGIFRKGSLTRALIRCLKGAGGVDQLWCNRPLGGRSSYSPMKGCKVRSAHPASSRRVFQVVFRATAGLDVGEVHLLVQDLHLQGARRNRGEGLQEGPGEAAKEGASPKGGGQVSSWVIIAAIHTDITELIRFYWGAIRLVPNQIVISRKELMETPELLTSSESKSM